MKLMFFRFIKCRLIYSSLLKGIITRTNSVRLKLANKHWKRFPEPLNHCFDDALIHWDALIVQFNTIYLYSLKKRSQFFWANSWHILNPPCKQVWIHTHIWSGKDIGKLIFTWRYWSTQTVTSHLLFFTAPPAGGFGIRWIGVWRQHEPPHSTCHQVHMEHCVSLIQKDNQSGKHI